MTALTQKFDIHTDLELAARVQSSFFPRNVPAVPGIEVYATAEPAHQVGGDFYDLIIAPDGDLFFAIGDVSYKGMSAALIMAILRKVFRISLKTIDAPSPGSVLRYINVDMYEDFVINGMFATLFVGQYKPEHRVLSLSNAGHSPVIYRNSDGCARLLEAGSAPLGVLLDENYEEQQLRLSEGDLLAVLTDGYPEAQNQTGELFGYSRILEIVDNLSSRTPAELAEGIYSEVAQFGKGHNERDDQAMVVLQGVL